MKKFTNQELKKAIESTLKLLYRSDDYSLINNIDVEAARTPGEYTYAAERSTVFRWALYLSEELKLGVCDPCDPDIKIDLEYNRKGLVVKIMENERRTPDLIIHKRNNIESYSEGDNILVVECKGHWNHDTSDEKKLKFMTSPAKSLHYQLGLFVKFEKEIDDTILGLKWFKDGEEISL